MKLPKVLFSYLLLIPVYAYSAQVAHNSITTQQEIDEILVHMVTIKAGKYEQRLKCLFDEGKITITRRPMSHTTLSKCLRSKVYTPILEKVLKLKLLDPNAAWQEGGDQKECIYTVLMESVAASAVANAEILLQNGAHPDTLSRFSNGQFITPLYAAVLRQNVSMLNSLFNYNANPNVQSAACPSLPISKAIWLYFCPAICIGEKENQENSKNALEVIRTLFNHKADPIACDHGLQTNTVYQLPRLNCARELIQYYKETHPEKHAQLQKMLDSIPQLKETV